MAVRVGYVGTQSAGDVLTSANFTKLPNGVIGYIKKTSNSTMSGTDTTITSVGPTINSNRAILVSAFGNIESTGAATATVRLKEGATILNTANIEQANGNPTFFYVEALILAPTAAAHTYLLTAASNAGAGIVAGTTAQPVILRVTDVGPTF